MPREVLTESVENSGSAKDAKEIKEADWIQTIAGGFPEVLFFKFSIYFIMMIDVHEIDRIS